MDAYVKHTWKGIRGRAYGEGIRRVCSCEHTGRAYVEVSRKGIRRGKVPWLCLPGRNISIRISISISISIGISLSIISSSSR